MMVWAACFGKQDVTKNLTFGQIDEKPEGQGG